jgi:uncharacterized membrane protein
MKIVKLIIFTLLVTASPLLHAGNDVTFTGTGKQVVEVGERFRIVYEVNADGSHFRAPDFGTLEVLSGPNTSTSSSIQYINGRMSQSYSRTYTFLVQAVQEGEVPVSPAKVVVDGKTYASNPITIKVVKSASGQKGTTRTVTTTRGGNNSTSDGILQDDDVFIKAYIDNKAPYIGEQIIITYKIYTKVPISNISMQKSPSYPGFWSKNLMKDNNHLKQSTQVINGEEYVVADIAKYALFPQKSGELTIEPMKIDCNVQIRVQSKRRKSYDPFDDFFNDPFFNRNVKNVETTLISKPIKINVKPLPQMGKPDSFNGAVGEFSFVSELENDHLKANDALTLKIKISGKGNIELISAPEVKFPPDFETYDPKVKSNIKVNAAGVSGSKAFEYLAIPRASGDFTIGPAEFSYFNPKDGKYHSFTSGELKVTVEKGDQNSQGITYSSSAQEDIRFIGQDIHHIKTGTVILKQKGNFLFASTLYYILMAVPVLLMILFIILWKQQEKRRSNVSLMKNRKANKIARSRLQKAEKLRKSGDEKAFYDELAQALWGYIADKFNIPKSNLSLDTVKETLHAKDVDDHVTSNFVNTLHNIDFARFAPGDSGGKMETVYQEAMNAIMQAEKQLK